MKKGTALLLFFISTLIVAAIYIAGNLLYIPVFFPYAIIATVSSCVYIAMFFHHNNEIGIAKMNGREVPEHILLRRRKRLKIMLIVFFPFLLVILCDSIYLLLIRDNPLFTPFLNLIK